MSLFLFVFCALYLLYFEHMSVRSLFLHEYLQILILEFLTNFLCFPYLNHNLHYLFSTPRISYVFFILFYIFCSFVVVVFLHVSVRWYLFDIVLFSFFIKWCILLLWHFFKFSVYSSRQTLLKGSRWVFIDQTSYKLCCAFKLCHRIAKWLHGTNSDTISLTFDIQARKANSVGSLIKRNYRTRSCT